MSAEVIGLDHVYLAVSDLARAEAFYDRAMAALGFKKVKRPLAGGDVHVHYYNRALQLSLRSARSERDHDAYAPGLHHLCLRVADREAVNTAAAALRARGVEASEPRLYPEYHEDYYATFFEDPDGIRLEVVNHLHVRKKTAEIWDQLPELGDDD